MNTAYDKEGFLLDLSAWDEEIAGAIAQKEAIDLCDFHWQIIEMLRSFYRETEVSPAMRPFVKLVDIRIGHNLGNSIELMKLFGSSPAKTAAKIAGLPKPTHCL